MLELSIDDCFLRLLFFAVFGAVAKTARRSDLAEPRRNDFPSSWDRSIFLGVQVSVARVLVLNCVPRSSPLRPNDLSSKD